MSDGRDDAPTPIPSRFARAGKRIRSIAIDLSPLRESRDFRLLWLGEVVSHTGRHVTVVALPYQVFLLTRSSLAVGMIGLVQFVPLIVFAIVGGVVADRVDRKKLLVATQAGLGCVSVLLVLAAVFETPLWTLYVLAALVGALTGLDQPARSAAIPRLVGRERIASAMVLNQLLFQVADVVGPIVGGIVLARLGLAWAYGIDAVSFLVALVFIAGMRPMSPDAEPGDAKGFHAVREGFAYLRGRRVLQSTFWVDMSAMVFGMPRALFPVLALEVFKVGPQGLGLMIAAPAAGAMLGALATGWVRHVRHQGRVVLWAVVVWGLAIAAFGLSTGAFWLALVFLAIAGLADVISAIFRGTILQASVPDRLRGRLSAIHFAVVAGGPRLGDVEAGVVAALVNPLFSVVSGGLLSVAGVGVLALLVPQFARYHAGEDA